jgi:hypothetical protein
MPHLELPPWYKVNWDTVYFDKVEVPGLCDVSAKRGPKWERKPVAGQTGETQSFKGWNNASFTITLRTWTDDQYQRMLTEILPIIEPEPGKEAPKEIGIEHPVCAARKIESFKINDIEGPTADADGCEWKIDAFQAIKKVPQQGGGGKPNCSNCQELKAAYDQSVAILQIAQVEYNNLLANLAPADQIEASNARLALAINDVTYCSNQMAEQKCNEQSPGSQASSEGAPPP